MDLGLLSHHELAGRCPEHPHALIIGGLTGVEVATGLADGCLRLTVLKAMPTFSEGLVRNWPDLVDLVNRIG